MHIWTLQEYGVSNKMDNFDILMQELSISHSQHKIIDVLI